MTQLPLRSPELLNPQQSRLLIIDVQAKLMPMIERNELLVSNCRRLIESAQHFQLPVTCTEQYPQGLGHTVVQLHDLIPTAIEKKRFSSAECIGWPLAGEDPTQRFQVVVAGIEAHVCVQQTVLDLIAMGYRVYVPVDAISSRFDLDYKYACDRMANSGAILTTTEAILFEWCETADHPAFKEISNLVKSRSE